MGQRVQGLREGIKSRSSGWKQPGTHWNQAGEGAQGVFQPPEPAGSSKTPRRRLKLQPEAPQRLAQDQVGRPELFPEFHCSLQQGKGLILVKENVLEPKNARSGTWGCSRDTSQPSEASQGFFQGSHSRNNPRHRGMTRTFSLPEFYCSELVSGLSCPSCILWCWNSWIFRIFVCSDTCEARWRI